MLTATAQLTVFVRSTSSWHQSNQLQETPSCLMQLSLPKKSGSCLTKKRGGGTDPDVGGLFDDGDDQLEDGTAVKGGNVDRAVNNADIPLVVEAATNVSSLGRRSSVDTASTGLPSQKRTRTNQIVMAIKTNATDNSNH